MSSTEDELVDSYGIGSAKERFDLIYENYSVFPQLVDCFEIGLFNTILNEKEYNRRAKNSADLGAAMFSMGLHSFMDLAKEAKAVYRIRRIVLVNTETIEEYLENFRDM